MACSFINSLYSSFGAGICTEKSGILLNNRGSCFTLEAGHPNVFGPSKRPMHTIIPAMIAEGETPSATFGVMGGQFQAFGHAQFVSNLVDFKLGVQEAIDQPRIFHSDGAVLAERGIPETACTSLRQMGHDVTRVEHPHGGAQAILIDRDAGVLTGGSDPRKDGCALGY